MTRELSRIHAKVAWVRGNQLSYDCTVTSRGGVIEEVVSGSTGKSTDYEVDLLLPGLINAHCHLEYTASRSKLPAGKVPFGEWLDGIISARTELTEEQIAAGIAEGERELLAGGCTTVFDSSTRRSGASEAASPLRKYVFHEVLGLTAERAQEQLGSAVAILSGATEGSLGAGINPHAPYSVGADLRQGLRELLQSNPDMGCAWHLAETADEEELLSSSTGSIAEFLARRGLPSPVTQPVVSKERSAATQMLHDERLLEKCDIAFHLNSGKALDWQHFAAPRAIVHCPGTHEYFRRDPFPMRAALGCGANVCLGTDSLASSSSLSMLEMIRLAANAFPSLSGGQLLDMATRNPARSRILDGLAWPVGQITAGYAADFVALRCRTGTRIGLREMLCDPATHVAAVVIGGKLVFES